MKKFLNLKNIRTNSRRLIKLILKYETKFYIKKNNAYVIGIMGWNGGHICKEALCNIYASRTNTFRNTIFRKRDIELPFEILGYKTIPKYNFLIPFLLIPSFCKILFSNKNNIVIIINFNTDVLGIMRYWQEIFSLDIGVFLNTNPGSDNIASIMLEMIKKNGTIVSNYDNRNMKNIALSSNLKKEYFGKNIKADMVWENKDNKCILKYKDDEVSYMHDLPENALMPVVASILTGIVSGISIHNCIDNLKGFNLPTEQVKSELYKFYD